MLKNFFQVWKKKSIEIDELCKLKLEEYNLPYYEIPVGKNTVKEILKLLWKKKIKYI